MTVGAELFVQVAGWLATRGADALFDRARGAQPAAMLDFGVMTPTTPFQVEFRPPRNSRATWALVGFEHEDERPPYVAPVLAGYRLTSRLPAGHYDVLALFFSEKRSRQETPALLGVGSLYTAIMPGPLARITVHGTAATRRDVALLTRTFGGTGSAVASSLKAALPAVREQQFKRKQSQDADAVPSVESLVGRASGRLTPHDISLRLRYGGQCYHCARPGFVCARCGLRRCEVHAAEACGRAPS